MHVQHSAQSKASRFLPVIQQILSITHVPGPVLGAREGMVKTHYSWPPGADSPVALCPQ